MQDIFPELRELAALESGDGNTRYEHFLQTKGYLRIAGCDEAGRGPLAGPVVAACVVLPDLPVMGKNAKQAASLQSPYLDSKILSHKKRQQLLARLRDEGALIGVGIVSPEEIDEMNILQASLHAMRLAVQELGANAPDFLLVDGKFPVPLSTPQLPLIKGERKSASIAAASIVAKETRDTIMQEMDERYPGYNFRKHKGYPTREHRTLIASLGPSPIHRRSFRGVREYIDNGQD